LATIDGNESALLALFGAARYWRDSPVEVAMFNSPLPGHNDVTIRDGNGRRFHLLENRLAPLTNAVKASGCRRVWGRENDILCKEGQ
jgi:hypothetical protein